MRKIASPYLLDASGRLVRGGVVSFDERGTVLSVDFPEQLDRTAGVEYFDGILIPGTTNAHCHLELSYLIGAIPEGSMLDGFVRSITQIRGEWSFEQQQQAAVEGDRFMWADGIAAVGDISNGTASFKAKTQSKILYQTYAEYFNMPPTEEAEAYFQEKTAHVAEAKKLGLSICPSPHSTYMVGDALFKLAAGSDRLSIHFMETATEVDFFKKAGGMYDLVAKEWGMVPDFLHYGSHPDRLVGSLPPDVPLLLVHNTQCAPADVEKVEAYFQNVTWVLCPRSNDYIERALPPAKMFEEMGVRVALGTDSLTSNHSLSIVEEIKWLQKTQPEVPLETVLRWATIGGAQGLGFDEAVGSFAVGKRPGAVLLEGVDLVALQTTSDTKARRLV